MFCHIFYKIVIQSVLNKDATITGVLCILSLHYCVKVQVRVFT